jgi:hypothetical protein
MNYPLHSICAAAPGYGSNRASCLARGQIRWSGSSVCMTVKDANPGFKEAV